MALTEGAHLVGLLLERGIRSRPPFSENGKRIQIKDTTRGLGTSQVPDPAALPPRKEDPERSHGAHV